MARKTAKRCSFALGDLQFEYLWERKSVKNLNLRVKAGGEVLVSTPTHVSEAQVERFLAAKTDFLRRALVRMQAKAVEPQLALEVGERIPIWGVLHTVVHQKAIRRGAFCENGCLVLCLKDPTDAGERKRVLADLLRTECVRVLTPLTAEIAPAVLPVEQGMPRVEFRQMKSRWGSCFYKQNRICYSTRLAFLSPEYARLVVCHELTHFLHHDHSAAFYGQLGTVLPQHKALRAQLKKEKIPRFTWDK